jgi:hypothetical protein
LSETLPVMLLNRAAKFSQQVLYVHLLHPVEVPAVRQADFLAACLAKAEVWRR